MQEKRERHQSGRLQQNNYASLSQPTKDQNEYLFVVQQVLNTVEAETHKTSDNVWYVDLGASNHMSCHREWFKDTKELGRPSYVETGDDTTHPITQIRNVPLTMKDGKLKYLANVLHVPNITKNLISVGQMIE